MRQTQPLRVDHVEEESLDVETWRVKSQEHASMGMPPVPTSIESGPVQILSRSRSDGGVIGGVCREPRGEARRSTQLGQHQAQLGVNEGIGGVDITDSFGRSASQVSLSHSSHRDRDGGRVYGRRLFSLT